MKIHDNTFNNKDEFYKKYTDYCNKKSNINKQLNNSYKTILMKLN